MDNTVIEITSASFDVKMADGSRRIILLNDIVGQQGASLSIEDTIDIKKVEFKLDCIGFHMEFINLPPIEKVCGKKRRRR